MPLTLTILTCLFATVGLIACIFILFNLKKMETLKEFFTNGMQLMHESEDLKVQVAERTATNESLTATNTALTTQAQALAGQITDLNIKVDTLITSNANLTAQLATASQDKPKKQNWGVNAHIFSGQPDTVMLRKIVDRLKMNTVRLGLWLTDNGAIVQEKTFLTKTIIDLASIDLHAMVNTKGLDVNAKDPKTQYDYAFKLFNAAGVKYGKYIKIWELGNELAEKVKIEGKDGDDITHYINLAPIGAYLKGAFDGLRKAGCVTMLNGTWLQFAFIDAMRDTYGVLTPYISWHFYDNQVRNFNNQPKYKNAGGIEDYLSERYKGVELIFNEVGYFMPDNIAFDEHLQSDKAAPYIQALRKKGHNVIYYEAQDETTKTGREGNFGLFTADGKEKAIVRELVKGVSA